jgi:hypothetical protein
VRAIIADPSSGPMQRTLEAMTTENFGAATVTSLQAERTVVPAQGGPAKLDLASYFQAMRAKLIDAQPVHDADLQQLSVARADAIKGYMLEVAKIPAERLEIIEPDVNDDKGEWVRCKLSLEAQD